MAEAAPTLADVQKQVDEQAALVRNLKAAKGDKAEIKAAVDKLVELKAKLATLAPADEKKFDRQAFEELMKRRFFFAPSFEIYGGVAGLYDYGPIGCAIKTNMLTIWRQHFILEENMLEVDCTGLTPEPVLVTSGHVARFTDVMVKDTKTGDCLRADHLLKDVMKKFLSEPNLTSEQRAEYEKVLNAAENYTKEELHEVFQKYQVKAPATNNDLTYPVDFNMMFTTPIGPTGLIKGFLRPETAQGIFVSFKRLLEFNNGRLPFAAAQIGKSFRNEIAPRSGLLRVREFEMAEIEHFCDPENKSLSKFKSVANLTVPLYDRKSQLAGSPLVKMTLKEAVDSGLLNNETLAYFLGRIYLYLQKIGIDVQDRLRFRQHQANEMAHYACDCWDAELLTSYGWIECVGCADRSCYDLTQHAKTTSTPMYASEVLPTPIIKDIVQAVGDKGVIGKNFKKDAKLVFDYLEGLDNDQATKLEADLNAGPVKVTLDGKEFTLDKSFIKVERVQKKEFERKFVPNVIEPSFGIGRVFYSLLEQTYGVRDNDVNRGWFKLPPIVAPLKCSILPLSNNEEFLPFIDRLKDGLNREGVSSRVDDSSAGIGKKYARTDEIAIPFGVTIDFETSKTDTATVRERDSMEQVRVKIDEIPALIRDLSSGALLWPAVVAKYGLTVTGSEKDAKE